MAGGRPTNYSLEIVEKAREYLDNFDSIKDEIIPSVVGLARYIKRSRETIYQWSSQEDKAEFSDIVKEIEDTQHIRLISGGLGNTYNASITKLMLTKHGYSDRQEVDVTSREEVTPWSDIQTDE